MPIFQEDIRRNKVFGILAWLNLEAGMLYGRIEAERGWKGVPLGSGSCEKGVRRAYVERSVKKGS